MRVRLLGEFVVLVCVLLYHIRKKTKTFLCVGIIVSIRTMPSVFDAFDRKSGNGSRSSTDDWLDEKSIFTNQWGSSAATTFNPTDTDAKGNTLSSNKQDKFEKLYELHNGKMEKTRKSDIRASHIKNDARAFVSVLEMPEQQRERVMLILNNLDISSNNFGGRPYEKIILSICTLVSDEALSEQSDPSIEDRLLFTDTFRELMDCTGTSSSDIRKLRRDVRDKSEYF